MQAAPHRYRKPERERRQPAPLEPLPRQTPPHQAAPPESFEERLFRLLTETERLAHAEQEAART